MPAGSSAPSNRHRAEQAPSSSDIPAALGEVEASVDRAVETATRWKESLSGTLDEKQTAVAEEMKRVGPPAWRIKEKFCRVLPCDACGEHCIHNEHAFHDAVNAKAGKPLHDPDNLRQVRDELNAIPLGEAPEGLNQQTMTAHSDNDMAFSIKGKSREIVRTVVAGGVGGGVGFALVDKFGVQMIAGLTPNAKDGIHAGVGAGLSILGAAMNKLWLAELGAGYLAVPIARLTERNALGGIPVGEVGVSQIVAGQITPTGQVIPAGQVGPVTYSPGVISDGRTGVVPTTVAGVKTF